MRAVLHAWLPQGEEGAVERTLRQSFLVSADMAHAQHPNYAGMFGHTHMLAQLGVCTCRGVVLPSMFVWSAESRAARTWNSGWLAP